MVLNIIAVALVAAITFMHSVFGLFSGLINVSCTILSAAVAFGFFEPVSAFFMQQFGLSPAYTESCSFVLLFVVTLVVLRSLADSYIRGNVRVPAGVDWAGAAICGFVNAQIIVGVLIIGVMMLPLGGRVMGFSRYERGDGNDPTQNKLARFERQSVWLMPDEFTIGLVKMLSGGSLSSGTPLAAVYPSFADWLYFTGNTVQWESTPSAYRDRKAGDGHAKGIQVKSWWEQTESINTRYRRDVPTEETPRPPYKQESFEPAAGNKFVGVRLQLSKASADRDGSRTVHLFRPTMLRLVGERSGGKPADAVARVVAGVDEAIGGAPRLVDFDNNLSIDGEATIDAFFEVPENFKPKFVEYRRRSRAGLGSAPLEAAGGKRPKMDELALQTPEERAARRQRGSFSDSFYVGSGDNPTIPFKLSVTKLRRGGLEMEGEKIKKGRLNGERSRFEPESPEDKVTEEMFLPEGWRLFQIRYHPNKARTFVGDVFNYVNRKVNQYFVIDNTGEKYMLDGYWVIVKRGNREHFEYYFSGDPDSPEFRGMLDFNDVKAEEFNSDETVIALMFLVKPGREIIALENQAGKRLEGFNFKMR